ncbi:uncharacterized protein LOC142163380 [Nicotiana tabacum]|uniref:Uncharacterized protein LOC142163380 n=1 Tax=Nicotiana tabacum TaxID=4097 RepID=A0AC58RVJ1_TOBAC
MLGKVNEEAISSAQPAAAGIFAFLSSIVDDMWIIDTRVTNHMVENSKLLTKLDKDSSLKGGNVHLPNGNVVSISNTGTSSILRNKDIQNVLHIPDFKFNLLSVSKLTKELKYCMAFFPDFCLFQDLFSGQVRGIGREDVDSETLVTVKQFLALMKNMFNSNVQTSRTDNGCEFFNSQFDELIKENGILHQSYCVYTTQQNGVVERKHISILNVPKSLRFQGAVPLKFWGECVDTIVYLLNMLPSATLQYKSFFQMLHSHPPNLDHLKTFGCLAYASNPNITDKMSPRAIPAALMGIPLLKKDTNFMIYHLHGISFFVSRNVVFREDLFPFKYFTPSTLPLFPVLEPIPDTDTSRNSLNTTPNSTTTSQTIQEELITENHLTSPPSINITPSPNNTILEELTTNSTHSTEPFSQSEPLRKSTRTVKQPLWMQDFITTKKIQLCLSSLFLHIL